jgi:pyruvate/2-oxoglutarate dehydrogenase complex dihydrolipoamide dehydrogenase (E3) component
MDRYDFAIVGAGPAGEAAAYAARARGASVVVIDRGWFGGSCPHIGCIPSKSLLHGATLHALGVGHDWAEVSARRDWIVNRAPDAAEPDDTSHVRGLEGAGAVTLRGTARIERPGRVRVMGPGSERVVETDHVVVAVGSVTKVPPIPGLETLPYWTNREATLARELPDSLLVLGGGPTACELAQLYVRFGVPTTIVQSRDRLVPSDHPRNAETIEAALRRDGVDVRLGVRAVAARAADRPGRPHVIELGDGSTADGHAVLLAVGREIPLEGLGLDAYGAEAVDAARTRDGRLRLTDGLWLIGDPAGPELHTHQAHYQGELAVRMALGEAVRPDYRALPRATYTDPEAAFVGVTLEAARAAGTDAFEVTAPFASSARGYGVEADIGHVSLVVDRGSRQLVGAAIACPDASAAIHECVLAIQARVPIEILAQTIHAFPSTSRILNGLFAEAWEQLDRPVAAA